MIVLDIGCAPHGGDEDSTGRLIKRFRPEVLFAFDPLVESTIYEREGTQVIQRGIAAWINSDGVQFTVNGIRSGVDEEGVTPVPTFDLCEFLRILPGQIILKMNIEGGEYPIMCKIREMSLDERLQVAIVQWHSEEDAHGFYGDKPELVCPVEDWWLWP